MTNEEAIKYLQQLYPNGGHCWLDEQRIKAIGMAIKALQEEPVSVWHNMNEVPIKGKVIVVQTKDTFYGVSVQKGGTTYKNKNKDKYIKWAYASDLLNLSNVERTVKNWKEEPVSEAFEEACEQLAENARKYKAETSSPFFSQTDYKQGVIDGAKWQKENLWKSADGDDLPEIDREVIVLIKYNAQRNILGEEYPTYRVGFGHRPNPNGWDGKNIDTNEVTHYTPKLYDKGGWNSPNIAYWLDVRLPKEIEL